ncbi:hypothetical protein [Vibrio sp. WXL103]|uniref:hypothetical protein n=1 Tax=Vibrio sp. WXL103 TaxID=3450710 RepID=UPI003EC687C5
MKRLMVFLLIIFSHSIFASEELFKFSCTDTTSENKVARYGWKGIDPEHFPDSHGLLELIVSDKSVSVLVNNKLEYEELIDRSKVRLLGDGTLVLLGDNLLKFHIYMFSYELEDLDFGIIFQYIGELGDSRIDWYCEERSQGKIYDNTSAFFDFMKNKLQPENKGRYDFIIDYWLNREKQSER